MHHTNKGKRFRWISSVVTIVAVNACSDYYIHLFYIYFKCGVWEKTIMSQEQNMEYCLNISLLQRAEANNSGSVNAWYDRCTRWRYIDSALVSGVVADEIIEVRSFAIRQPGCPFTCSQVRTRSRSLWVDATAVDRSWWMIVNASACNLLTRPETASA